MLNGIDISNWQANLDLAHVPFDFAIIKATEGVGYVNPTCDKHYQQAKKLGKLRGVYHFASGGDAIKEADYFVNNIKGYIGDSVLALDFEGKALSKGIPWAHNWLWRVYELTNVWPLIYISQSVAADPGWGVVATKCGLWVARYPTNKIVNYDSALGWGSASIGPWKMRAIWQYTSSGRLPGYQANLDLNHAYMTEEAWKAYAMGERNNSSNGFSNDNIISDNISSISTLENESYKITVEQKG